MGLRAHNNRRRILLNLHFHLSFFITLFLDLPSGFRLGVVRPAVGLPHLCISFSCSLFFSLCRHIIFLPLSSLYSLFLIHVFGFRMLKKEIKEHRSCRLTFIETVLYFSLTSFSPVFLIDWPGGLADPERDERAEQHKKPKL